MRITGLQKIYRSKDGSDIHALADINLDIQSAELISVVGPSGCGKTTLLKILAGILDRSAGEVFMQGHRLRGPSRAIGVVFQAPVLLPWRTVLGNVMVPVEIQRRDRAEFEARARQLIAAVGLSGFESKYPQELSGGMQQRVGICRALVHDPSFLLMDEPFGALDAMTRDLLHDEIERICADRTLTVLFVTHNVREAARLGDRVVLLSSRPGRVLAEYEVPRQGPRRIDSPEVARLAATLTDRLREEMGRHGN